VAVIILAYNFYRISKDRSTDLQNEVMAMSPGKNRKMLFALRVYILLSSLLFLGVIAVTVHTKKKYGNYDLH
jgi:hypothetical protein